MPPAWPSMTNPTIEVIMLNLGAARASNRCLIHDIKLEVAGISPVV